MTFNELKEILNKHPFLVEQKYIYIDLKRFSRDYYRWGRACYILIKDIFGKYCVRHNIDFEYARVDQIKEFKNLDLAADYLWEIFGGENKLNELIEKYK